MNYKLADRVHKVQPSFTLQMATVAAEMRAEGVNVINFSVGEPDFNTPLHIIRAGQKAMDEGYTKYTAGPGMIEFRKAICEKLKRENDITYTPADILVSNGEKQSLYNVCQALFEAGDSVIVFRPYWVSFPEFVRLADAEPVLVDTVPEHNFEPDFNDLQVKKSPDVKGVIVNSPSNPTGGVWGEDALLRLLKIAKENSWVVISDECYERLVYEGEFYSTEKLNRDHQIGANVVTCLSLSKTYAMTGWRIGYGAGITKIIKAMAKLQSQSTTNPSSISQAAATEALNGNQDFILKRNQSFKERRDFVVEALNKIAGISCLKPNGAFYVFPNCSKFFNKKDKNGKIIKNDSDFVNSLLENYQVAVVQGSAFGLEGYFRISYATSMDNLKKALERISNFCKSLS